MKKRRIWIPIAFLVIYSAVIIYHQFKPLPDGVSYAGDIHVLAEEEIEFLYDLTFQLDGEEHYDQHIYDGIQEIIEQAEEFLIIDMFMINESTDEGRDFPGISSSFSEKIVNQMEAHPDLKVVIITDPINTTYGSHEAEHIASLGEAGAEVVYTDLTRLRDSNPLYTGIWRMFFQWFGEGGTGWVPNAFGSTSPDVTFRSYLKMLNVKANHRKAVMSENGGMYMSWNAHDASSLNSDIAVRVQGEILKDMIEAEKAVAAFSGGNLATFPTEEEIAEAIDSSGPGENNGNEIKAQVVTERQIEHAFIQAMDLTEAGDEVWIGMFYLADRHIVEAISDAASRDVKVQLILDPNQNAFGQEKIGLPNIAVAKELLVREDDNIKIRWYNTNEEQYHSKITYFKRGEESQVIAGSTNYTSRNLDNYNLENNLNIVAPTETQLIQDIEDYFQRIWENEDGEFTLDYEEYEDSLSTVKYIIYFIQNSLRLTTF